MILETSPLCWFHSRFLSDRRKDKSNMLLFLIQMFVSAAMAAPAPNPNATLTSSPSRDSKQCFSEGRWYPAGTVITSGRSHDWCYGSYCDVDGMVKHWDDFTCGGASAPKIKQQVVTPEIAKPPRVTPAPYVPPPTTTDWFSGYGCWYRNRFYWSGQDIENFRRGVRCWGKYCDWDGRIQSWSDHCRYSISTVPVAQPDYT